jgi:hypothetical protein
VAASAGPESLIGGGLGWTREPGEVEVMSDLFGTVGGLRVLSWPIEDEGEAYVNQSILKVRDELTSALKRLPRQASSTPSVRSMREACNSYLQAAPDPDGYQPLRPHFERALRRWRETVYEDVKSIAYGLKLDDALRLMKEMRESFG